MTGEAWSAGVFITTLLASSARLMATLDAVNARHGRGTVRPLATGLARSWGTRRSHLSSRYTTQVAELMEAEAW